MKTRILAAVAALALCFSLPVVFADDMSKDKMMQDEMMKKWQEFATPGDAHKMMANLVGTWDTVVKSYMDPAAPTETKGTSTFTAIMDGRYIQEVAEGNFMGMPFHGMGVYGYDNILKKYVASWVDNMGTGIMYLWGTSDDGGKTVSWDGKSSDPMTGKEQSYRSAMHMMSPDQYHLEMYGPGPDGKEMKAMEISYTRTK